MSTLAAPQRQSPWAVIFLAVRIVAKIGVVQIAAAAFIVFTRGINGWLLIAIPTLGVLLLISALLSWWRFTFHVVGGEFVVRSGVLRTERLSVPVERIQSVSEEQELLHRIVGVVRLSLDTAGSDETEFRIDAVPHAVGSELRDLIARTTTSPPLEGASPAPGAPLPPPTPPPTTLLAHSPRRLLIAALTSWPWASLAIFGPILAAFSQANVDVPTPDVDPDGFRWWWVPAIASTFVAVSVVLNVIRMITTNWNLMVEADGDSIRRSSGLVARRHDARDAGKVQVVSTSRNPVQRRFGLSEVSLSIIGDGGLNVIGCDDGEVATLTAASSATPMPDLESARRIHRAEVLLKVRNTAVGCVLVGGFAALLVGWWATLVAVIVPIEWWRQWRHVRNYRWDVTDHEIFARGRIIDDWSEQSLLRKTNGVRVRRSLFQRRRDLASVDVETASGTITIGMLPLDEAHALRDRVLAAVLVDDRSWM